MCLFWIKFTAVGKRVGSIVSYRCRGWCKALYSTFIIKIVILKDSVTLMKLTSWFGVLVTFVIRSYGRYSVECVKMTSTEKLTNQNRESYINELENKLDEQDAKIRHLNNEVEKYKQIVQPLTNLVFELQTASINEDSNSDKVNKRTKKIAISAEPTTEKTKLALELKKYPKSERYLS